MKLMLYLNNSLVTIYRHVQKLETNLCPETNLLILQSNI
jgi:hypothetical protein